MVNHLICSAKARILIFNGVEAMRTAGNNLFDVISVEYFYIGHCLHLEQKFISCPLCGISGTAFFSSQNCIFHAYMVQDLTDITSGFLCSFIIAPGTTYPKQDFWFFTFGYQLCHCWHFKI
ncbi:hypothetical protein D3C85_1409860 [compost metagenome]